MDYQGNGTFGSLKLYTCSCSYANVVRGVISKSNKMPRVVEDWVKIKILLLKLYIHKAHMNG